jgi:stearoyl-CoA desaturase (delta-9 desaturase)
MSTAEPVCTSRHWTEYFKPISIPFWGVHVAAVAGVVYSGFSWSGLLLAIALYYARMFFVTAGYHRYFAHRTYKTSRLFQFLLGFGAETTAQKGILWWAANHRHHHRYSDTPQDIHSPKQGGFFWSHMGWIIVRDFEETDYDAIKDMARYPELRLLNRLQVLPPIIMAVSLYLIGGWHALLWGFFVSTVLLWHGTFTINSLSHVFGKQRYETGDTSRNNWLLALVTMGEGWHNNHHYHMNSANQGFFWYEIDMSYYVLKVLSWFGIVWDLRKPPQHILEGRGKRRLSPVVAAPRSASPDTAQGRLRDAA